jgi:hypothetical protein
MGHEQLSEKAILDAATAQLSSSGSGAFMTRSCTDDGRADLVNLLRRLSAEVALAEDECHRLEKAVAAWATQSWPSDTAWRGRTPPLPQEVQGFDLMTQSLAGLRLVLEALGDQLPKGTAVPIGAMTKGLPLRDQADRLNGRAPVAISVHSVGEADFF